MSTVKHEPTLEQKAIVEAFKTEKLLKIQAYSGASKSTTMVLLAEDNIAPSIYLAFNKAIADDAKGKFPDHVTCKTVHSLAYASFGSKLSKKLTRDRGTKYVNVAGTPSEIVKFYSIPSLMKANGVLESRAIATLVKRTVGNYQNSAEDVISGTHIPKHELDEILNAHSDVNKDDLVTKILYYSNRLWSDRIDTNSVVLAEHDTYLKLWQLSKPQLPYDIIYGDEFQDVVPVMLDVILNQKHAKVCVCGDENQNIYSWKGTVNAMQSIECKTLPLSKSFRFGQDIADLANTVFSNKISMVGYEERTSKVGWVNSTNYTHIFRTNGALLAELIDLIGKGRRVKALVDTRKFESMLRSAFALRTGKGVVKDEDITLYSTWAELVEESNDDPELARLVNIINKRKTFEYLDVISRMKSAPKEYDVLLVTAHKSKGLEWDNVIIGDDFDVKYLIAKEGDYEYNLAELNLMYVAFTRAKKVVQLPDQIRGWYSNSKNRTVEDEFWWMDEE